uniref:TSA: Wollemia nobilis Ref_Wollemi_Transcript_14429_3694 transcribed RNA sequence n=1 Tax=Wollemia nobilis TaxID=56998 RepID=A0A0C9S401_9CONI
MNRRVRRKVGHVKETVSTETSKRLVQNDVEETAIAKREERERERQVDWSGLPDDTVVAVFSLLNYRDRASLASVCRTWRFLGSLSCLWTSLDIRAHTLDAAAATSLSKRCSKLRSIRFRGATSANIVIHLEARDLREISAEGCRELTDGTLGMLAGRHRNLEALHLGPDFCERVTADAVKVVALCCPKLRRLRLSGLREVDAGAIRTLAERCLDLSELGFADCASVDEAALGNVKSLKFLSVAGCRNIKWPAAAQAWPNLPNLVGLDVSRTDVNPNTAHRFMFSKSLRVLCALSCGSLEGASDYMTIPKSKVMLSRFTDVLKGMGTLLSESPEGSALPASKKHRIACLWRERSARKAGELRVWLEWVLSYALLRMAESNTPGWDGFWITQGAPLLLDLVKSSQVEVQERAATALATFVVIDDETATVDPTRAEAVMQGGGIRFLLDLARSCREGVQSEAAKAIANLSVNADVAKAVAVEGGISILAALARSPNRWVVEEAAGGLWNLSVGEEHKAAIAEAGGIKALVDLVFKWPSGGEGVLERAAGALANLAADDKCSMEVAMAGGVHALVRLARFNKHEGVQEQAARALANLAAHGDSNGNNSAVGQEVGALEALVHLTRSHHEGVRQEAAGALWNLSFDDRNREAIAAAGGVEALVALAQNCANASQGLQERAAGALWGLSVSEANSIAIGQEGGVSPLIALARSGAEDVHETAAGALWNLAFNAGNAWRIVEEGGVPALVHLCSTSGSKMARFMAALALAYMFDGRMDEVATTGMLCDNVPKGSSLEHARRMAMKHIEGFVQTFSDPQSLSAAASSWAPPALAHVAETARIHEAGHLRCSGAEVGRFVVMLRHGSPVLKACAAFALLQFTMPGGRHAMHHASLLHKAVAGRVLRAAAAAATAPLQAKVFARIVLRNLEHYPADAV